MSDLTATLAERGARYGKFEDRAVIAQGLKDQMWATEGWSRLAPDQRQALEVIQDKVARILNGDPDYTDNWHDIAGYARLVEDRLTERAAALKQWDEPMTAFAGECMRPRTTAEQIAPEPDWIEWAGGERPVPEIAIVDVQLRGGYTARKNGAGLDWDHRGMGTDIVAYRLSAARF